MTDDISSEKKRGTIAFSTTPQFRDESEDQIKRFVYEHLYSLCFSFNVWVTGGTYIWLEENILTQSIDHLEEENRDIILKGRESSSLDEGGFEKWKETIRTGLRVTKQGIKGMIHVTYELVEGRLDAVIHLAHWEDKAAKPDTAVLSREANVHNVPIATDLRTAQAFAQSWRSSIARFPSESVFVTSNKPKKGPLDGIKAGDRVLAMVSHDKMKLEICRFAVEHAGRIFEEYKIYGAVPDN